jgi:hypothetical protein
MTLAGDSSPRQPAEDQAVVDGHDDRDAIVGESASHAVLHGHVLSARPSCNGIVRPGGATFLV